MTTAECASSTVNAVEVILQINYLGRQLRTSISVGVLGKQIQVLEVLASLVAVNQDKTLVLDKFIHDIDSIRRHASKAAARTARNRAAKKGSKVEPIIEGSKEDDDIFQLPSALFEQPTDPEAGSAIDASSEGSKDEDSCPCSRYCRDPATPCSAVPQGCSEELQYLPHQPEQNELPQEFWAPSKPQLATPEPRSPTKTASDGRSKMSWPTCLRMPTILRKNSRSKDQYSGLKSGESAWAEDFSVSQGVVPAGDM